MISITSQQGIFQGLRSGAPSNRSRGKTYISVLNDGNTVAWYDGSELSTITKDVTTSEVSRWKDKLLSGRDLLQSVATKYPIYSSDGILFDGSNDYMKAAGFTFIQPEFIYIVVKQLTWTLNDIFFDGNTTVTGMIRDRTGTPKIEAYAGAYSADNSDLALNTWKIIRCLFNGASSKLQVGESAAITGSFGAQNMNGFTLGANGNTTQGWANIQVKEVILRKIADEEKDEKIIYNYLKNKYNLL